MDRAGDRLLVPVGVVKVLVGGPGVGWGCVGALEGWVVCVGAQAYFGARPGLAPGRRHDGHWVTLADGGAAAHPFWACPRVGSARSSGTGRGSLSQAGFRGGSERRTIRPPERRTSPDATTEEVSE